MLLGASEWLVMVVRVEVRPRMGIMAALVNIGFETER